MRGLGLVGFLVGIAILVIVWANYTSQVAKTNKEIRPQVEQLAGQDSSGRRVSDSYTLKTIDANGRFHGLRVQTMAPDSPMRSFFGLKEGDVIVEVSSHGTPFKARETDSEMLKAYVAEAYQFKQPIVVERDGKQVTLNPTGKTESNDVNSTLEGLTNPR